MPGSDTDPISQSRTTEMADSFARGLTDAATLLRLSSARVGGAPGEHGAVGRRKSLAGKS